ncbi:CheY-like chemotaxis protein [Granulicella aggregans]|uniref:CheY-like chemotaxis protein n=1 Tax=Granulicella aggregans TaxID=474949 RepID=A0A7W7ZG98_9BACT|nr:response regulator [Granulicella aggregans]MBB5059188.1 CheY-like chemotaxis protein [Granulicella aggregans]
MAERKPKLLIVDDEPTTRDLLTQVFTRRGHDVLSAKDGFAALEQIKAESPDVILSDLNMPGMSGFELLSVVRRRIPGIYVIATSGAFAGDGVPNGIAADAYYAKATGLTYLFDLMQNASLPNPASRNRSSSATPIWISPTDRDASLKAQVLISCSDCLRAFSLSVEAADFVIHETLCVYCGTQIHYATVQPMNPASPLQFSSQERARAEQ